MSKGEYLTWTSDDNIYLPEALEQMVNTINQNDVEFVFANCDIIDENGKIIEVLKVPQDFRDSIHAVNRVGACFLYTRKDFFGSCIFSCQSALKFMHGDDKKKAKKIIEKYANECKLNKNELTHVDGNNRFWYSFANKCFMLCCKVRSVSGIGF